MATVFAVTDPLTGILRVKAVCVFMREDRILAIDAFDPTKSERFWGPIGGKVKFGETSRHAIARGVKEELSAEVIDVELLGSWRASSHTTEGMVMRSSSFTTVNSQSSPCTRRPQSEESRATDRSSSLNG